VPEVYFAAIGQRESIAQEEGVRVSDNLSWQEKLDLAVWAWGCRRDLQPTSVMRDARDRLSVRAQE